MKTLSWVETIACTKPLPKPRIRKWDWIKIYENDVVNFWICEQDLKDTFVEEAKIAFGKTLEQVVRLGSYPAVEYPEPEDHHESRS
jgi:hypothetical protein